MFLISSGIGSSNSKARLPQSKSGLVLGAKVGNEVLIRLSLVSMVSNGK